MGRMQGQYFQQNNMAAKKKCYNCKYASQGFKIGGKTHHQCNHPKHKEGIENGTLSPFDTLQEFYNTCESYESRFVKCATVNGYVCDCLTKCNFHIY